MSIDARRHLGAPASRMPVLVRPQRVKRTRPLAWPAMPAFETGLHPGQVTTGVTTSIDGIGDVLYAATPIREARPRRVVAAPGALPGRTTQPSWPPRTCCVR